MFEQIFESVRQKSPLVHCITNYVTVNDCTNMLLACGGSPIMADDPGDAVEITSICGGLTINIGTLNQRTIPAMLAAGKRANELGHPVVLDPVGAGASTLRTDTALRLLKEVKFAVIRGNISEIKTLASGSGTTKGVDADVADRVTEDNLDGAVSFVKELARRIGAVIAVTGAIALWRMRSGPFVYARPSGDVLHHRNRLPTLCSDCGLCHSKPGSVPGGRCGRRVRHGSVRRDCLQAYDRAGR